RQGSIGLWLGTADGHALIKVEENGIGIARHHLSRVFDMFAQVRNASMEHKTGGLGIGLNIAAKLVAMHKGTIDVHSDGLGKGSTFTISLPLLLGPIAAEGPEASDRAYNAAAQRILVVDDNVDAAASLALLLRAAGHEVSVAHNGVQALEIGQHFEPSTVFM